ncbi:chromate transporter [Microvirga antarctica]|uniref:chromate transporter n=1 Tax=Microvirga antarctica TaxID=2819233 RepID=UPI001B302AEF|nr:chromate transporter [Microvirga antarctica]
MTPADDTESTLKSPTVFALFTICLWIGLFSFGGGLSAWIHREFVTRRRWITEDEFMNGLALGQILPGANITNLTVYIGQRLLGPRGAAAALLGLLVGPFLAVIALVSLYETFADLAWLHRGLSGAAAVAIGLMFAVAVKGARRAARAYVPSLVMAATVIAVGFLKWPLLPVVAVLGVISVAMAFLRSDV